MKLAVACEDPARNAEAEALAGRLQVPLWPGEDPEGRAGDGEPDGRSRERRHPSGPASPDPADGESAYRLVVTAERLELRTLGPKAPGPVYADFVGGKVGYRHRHGGGRGQPIAKAVGLKKGGAPSVLDATAGLGRDAFVLASLGCEVTLIERSPVVAALLRDGLARALVDPEAAQVVARMGLIEGDAVDRMEELAGRFEVVHLDPMYPHRDKSALVKKEMRLFRELVGEDPDADRLLEAALRCAGRRVVVKRPRLAPPLGERKPSHTVEGKTTRYDVYVV